MARRRKLGGTYDELEQALKEVEGWKPAVDPCQVHAGFDVYWDGELKPAQCTRFPPGKSLGRGVFASAYEHAKEPSKVVKFTGDAHEASVARRFLGKKLKGSVNVFDVARLKEQTASVPVPNEDFTFFGRAKGRPVFALTTEKVGPLSRVNAHAVDSVHAQYRRERSFLSKQKPSEFWANIVVDVDKAAKRCAWEMGDESERPCRVAVGKIVDAIQEQAENGVIPLDLHNGNWGERPDGTPVILDFGVASVEGQVPDIDLAKAPRPRRVAKRRRVR